MFVWKRGSLRGSRGGVPGEGAVSVLVRSEHGVTVPGPRARTPIASRQAKSVRVGGSRSQGWCRRGFCLLMKARNEASRGGILALIPLNGKADRVPARPLRPPSRADRPAKWLEIAPPAVR